MADEVKIIAIYVPQFYETKNNNKLWSNRN